MSSTRPSDLVGSAEAAEILNVSQRTVNRRAAAGKLPVWSVTAGRYLFQKSKLEALREEL